MEIVRAPAVKTISNHSNNLFNTEGDPAFTAYKLPGAT